VATLSSFAESLSCEVLEKGGSDGPFEPDPSIDDAMYDSFLYHYVLSFILFSFSSPL
jgi:hypothetical protein